MFKQVIKKSSKLKKIFGKDALKIYENKPIRL